jgi:hypothetical protein
VCCTWRKRWQSCQPDLFWLTFTVAFTTMQRGLENCTSTYEKKKTISAIRTLISCSA